MRDRHGVIIYVGKAISLRKRVRWYFRNATLADADPKLRSLIKSIHDFDFIVVRNEAEALLTEGGLIKDYKPRYNVAFKDDKRFLLLRANAADPYPMFKLCRIKRDDGALYFGAYTSSQSARATLDFIGKKFGIRRCAPRVPNKDTHKHCLNDIIRYCMAPCIGKCDNVEYRKKFDEACAFLRGERMEYLKELRLEMKSAAEKMKFEYAAALRDTLLLIDRAVRQNARMTKTPRMKKEDAMAGIRELGRFLKTHVEPRVIEAYDISNISGTYAVASMVCFIDGMPVKSKYMRFRIKTIAGSDDPGMMREVVRRRYTRLLTEKKALPDIVLVDGGLAQMRAARDELSKLGITSLPVLGLAKKFEEIYMESASDPVRLPWESASLRVLQRLRDEAHRFALAYHHNIRARRIRESALDDMPGIGDKRKSLLLKHFGSVRRISSASVDEIAEVPGIGMEMANMIKQGLMDSMR
ncbi:MAG: excinuclease ABC subunit UvrC [Lentisphaerae bacterium]|nr:excinuclease ABC subunit UvrC [Lentisphaerota bacterium]